MKEQLMEEKCCIIGYEPIGNDFEGSSITVPVGAEEVSGLTEAVWE